MELEAEGGSKEKERMGRGREEEGKGGETKMRGGRGGEMTRQSHGTHTWGESLHVVTVTFVL